MDLIIDNYYNLQSQKYSFGVARHRLAYFQSSSLLINNLHVFDNWNSSILSKFCGRQIKPAKLAFRRAIKITILRPTYLLKISLPSGPAYNAVFIVIIVIFENLYFTS